MRRTVLRGFVLVGVGMLGLTGTGSLAGAATGDDEASPDMGYWYGTSPGTLEPPSSEGTPESPTISATSLTSSPSPTPTRTRTQHPTDSVTHTRSRTATASPTHTRIHLHTAIVGARMTGAGPSLARFAVRVRATGGTAHGVVSTVKIRPKGPRFAVPGACRAGSVMHCRLGKVHGTRLLSFRERAGHAKRFTITVTTRASDAATTKHTLVLVLRKAPRSQSAPRDAGRDQGGPSYGGPEGGPDYGGPNAAPDYAAPGAPDHAAPPETVTRHRYATVTGPPATVYSLPDGAQAPMNQNVGTSAKPRLPVIAPRPGPRPTPNGAPVTVRPVANGHAVTGDASGMPTRTIFGLLAAAASFVGLVTALVLIRRRNEG